VKKTKSAKGRERRGGHHGGGDWRFGKTIPQNLKTRTTEEARIRVATVTEGKFTKRDRARKKGGFFTSL